MKKQICKLSSLALAVALTMCSTMPVSAQTVTRSVNSNGDTVVKAEYTVEMEPINANARASSTTTGTIVCTSNIAYQNPLFGSNYAVANSLARYKADNGAAVMDKISAKIKYYKNAVWQGEVIDDQTHASYAGISYTINASSGIFLGSHIYEKSGYQSISHETSVTP